MAQVFADLQLRFKPLGKLLILGRVYLDVRHLHSEDLACHGILRFEDAAM
jgi:hypothetical protein